MIKYFSQMHKAQEPGQDTPVTEAPETEGVKEEALPDSLNELDEEEAAPKKKKPGR